MVGGRLRWKASIVQCRAGGGYVVLRLGLQKRRVERGDRGGRRAGWDYIAVIGVMSRIGGGMRTWDEK